MCCSIVYELLDLLGHNLGTVPRRLIFGLHGHRWWEKTLGLGLRLFFGRSVTLAPEAREERHCGTREGYTDPLVRVEQSKIRSRRLRVVAKTLIGGLAGEVALWE